MCVAKYMCIKTSKFAIRRVWRYQRGNQNT